MVLFDCCTYCCTAALLHCCIAHADAPAADKGVAGERKYNKMECRARFSFSFSFSFSGEVTYPFGQQMHAYLKYIGIGIGVWNIPSIVSMPATPALLPTNLRCHLAICR